MALGEYIKAFNWITERISQFTAWLKKKKRRDSVNGMEKDVADNNVAGIDKRLQDLKRKAKDRDNSR